MDEERIKKIMRAEAEAVFDKKIKNVQFENFKTPRHEHNGKDAPRINQSNIAPGYSALGSIEMSENKRYRLGLTFNPSQMLFFGVAVGPGGERVQIASVARFGTSYYFQPESTDSVTQGGIELNVVQGGSWLWTVNGSTSFRSRAIEGHLVNIDSNGTTIVARATIPNLSTQASLSYGNNLAPVSGNYGDRSNKGYGQGFVDVDVVLATGWSILATFIVS